MIGWQRIYDEYLVYIPRGDSIDSDSWRFRHRIILGLLWLHVPFLFLLGRFDGHDPYLTGATYTADPLSHVLVGVGAIVALALVAGWSRVGRRRQATIASIGLMTCSAVLTHFWGGFIEGHFHFFVMVGVIAAYEDWLPFLMSILYVALHHGVGGTLFPEEVYNHPAAVENPWAWSAIHAVFILALSAAIVSHWLSIERSREETERQIRNVQESREKQTAIEEAKADVEAKQREVEQLNRTLLDSADEIAGAMEAVAEGDFTATPPEQADVEAITRISRSFEEMTDELSSTVVELQTFAGTVEATTRSVHEDATALERNQQQLAADVRSFADDLRTQADDLESTTDELSTLSATIEEIAANAEQVSAEATTAADASESGTETAAEAIEAIEAIERSVSELTALVESLDSRMDDVAESTTLIDDIAEQTNILALNANIEAARATDDGGGFGVVAEEVKTLADETRTHSSAIERTIERTIEDVDRVQAEMARTRSQIETGRTTMGDADEAFTGLAETVETVDASVEEVADATDDGARTTEEVVNAVRTIAEQSRTIADGSESLADRAETSADTIATVRSQLDELTDQTADLQERLATFECAADDVSGPILTVEPGRH